MRSQNPTVMKHLVTPREGRVSRNEAKLLRKKPASLVAPREGRVSRNVKDTDAIIQAILSRPARSV